MHFLPFKKDFRNTFWASNSGVNFHESVASSISKLAKSRVKRADWIFSGLSLVFEWNHFVDRTRHLEENQPSTASNHLTLPINIATHLIFSMMLICVWIISRFRFESYWICFWPTNFFLVNLRSWQTKSLMATAVVTCQAFNEWWQNCPIKFTCNSESTRYYQQYLKFGAQNYDRLIFISLY